MYPGRKLICASKQRPYAFMCFTLNDWGWSWVVEQKPVPAYVRNLCRQTVAVVSGDDTSIQCQVTLVTIKDEVSYWFDKAW